MCGFLLCVIYGAHLRSTHTLVTSKYFVRHLLIVTRGSIAAAAAGEAYTFVGLLLYQEPHSFT